jgi:hypothetical protein
MSRKSLYLLDRRLIPRVKHYFEQHPEKKFTHTVVEEIILYLKTNYREYQRKPENALRLSVQKGKRR